MCPSLFPLLASRTFRHSFVNCFFCFVLFSFDLVVKVWSFCITSTRHQNLVQFHTLFSEMNCTFLCCLTCMDDVSKEWTCAQLERWIIGEMVSLIKRFRELQTWVHMRVVCLTKTRHGKIFFFSPKNSIIARSRSHVLHPPDRQQRLFEPQISTWVIICTQSPFVTTVQTQAFFIISRESS